MKIEKVLKTISDKRRLRILMLLDTKELCVCQIMAIIGVSQSLVSKNLSLLSSAEFLEERRDGKLVFYKVKKAPGSDIAQIMRLLRILLKGDKDILSDLKTLDECMEFQKKTGSCNMKTFLAYMRQRKKKRNSEKVDL
jgi:DNA-binding transcriptional ArsR family regulator